LHAAIDAHADRDAKSILLVTDKPSAPCNRPPWDWAATFTGASPARC
jgi:hypothetical protein